MTHPVPVAALDDRLGWVGTSGSGKTYGAGTCVERLLDKRARVIVIDPLGVWYGLRLLPDGKTASGYNVVIFGGRHADLPINEHAGALVGETVAGMAESCVVDLTLLGTKAAERRFMLAFLTALYKHASGEPVHLVIDEADMFAPQKLMDKDGDAARLLGQMETIVRRGRVKGFIPWLITQRPAVLSKDVLSQVDGLIAFKLTSSQDRNALGGWVEGQADEGQWKEIKATLPTLERGNAVVWLPTRAVLDNKQFPPKATFDSSRTPKRGERQHSAALTPLNIESLKTRLSKVTEEAKANDPAALRKRISDLERELKVRPIAATNGADLAAEFGRGHSAGFREGRKLASALMATKIGDIKRELDAAVAVVRDMPIADGPAPPPRPVTVAPASAGRFYPKPDTIMVNGTGSLSKAERLIMSALAQYPQGRTKEHIAVLTGYAGNGGAFNNALGSLRSKGYAEGYGGPIRATQSGIDALGSYEPLPTGRALLEHWLAKVGLCERKILYALSESTDGMSKEELGSATGYEANGGSFNNSLGRLRTLELVQRGQPIKLSDNLFG